MHVTELNEDELFQLKEELYYGDDGLPNMTDAQADYIFSLKEIDDVPNELVYELYDGYDFVEDDFWCNVKNKR